MSLRLTCACGWTVEGSRSEVLEAARRHGRELHNMEATDDELEARIERVEE